MLPSVQVGRLRPDTHVDACVRSLSSRRAAGGFAVAGLLRAFGANAAAPKPAGCIPIGRRCGGRGGAGKRGRRSCQHCCSDYAAGERKRRCSCVPAGSPCARDDQCCTGRCGAATAGDAASVCVTVGPPEAIPPVHDVLMHDESLFVRPPTTSPPVACACVTVAISPPAPIEDRCFEVIVDPPRGPMALFGGAGGRELI
ncbi:MAG TPA: hypothetical protein VFQ80_11815, partial [Thermomicrobiales bacterium]|nr:hypothetical protein [Thermomicrobiales bacterium]